MCVTSIHASKQSYSSKALNEKIYRSELQLKIKWINKNYKHETPYPHKKWDAIIRKGAALRALSILIKFGGRLPTRVKVNHKKNTKSSLSLFKSGKHQELIVTLGTSNTIGISGTRTMGQAVSFKSRMGHKLTQILKLRRGTPRSQKPQFKPQKKNIFLRTLMSFMTSAQEKQKDRQTNYNKYNWFYSSVKILAYVDLTLYFRSRIFY